MKLHIGCGGNRIEGFINIDLNPECRPDVVMDLPRDFLVGRFGENSVDEIYSCHALEHMSPILTVIWDMWIVSKPDAIWAIEVPHADYEIGNPYHLTKSPNGRFASSNPLPDSGIHDGGLSLAARQAK